MEGHVKMPHLIHHIPDVFWLKYVTTEPTMWLLGKVKEKEQTGGRVHLERLCMIGTLQDIIVFSVCGMIQENYSSSMQEYVSFLVHGVVSSLDFTSLRNGPIILKSAFSRQRFTLTQLFSLQAKTH